MPPAANHSLTRICVFCGSSFGKHGDYRQAAADLGVALVERGCGLVYGGGSVGLMGTVADAVLGAGGNVLGVIPEFLATKELLHTGLTELQVVPSMHARKAHMADSADAFIALPGGFGTFEELLEVITWGQLGRHRKPIGLLNVRGFFDRLVEFLQHAIAEGFIRPEHAGLFVVADDPRELLDKLATQPLPEIRKWITDDES